MAMNVSSSTNSAKLQQAPQQNQAQRAAAPKTKAVEQQPKQAEQAQKPEQPRPVVNSQGQVTGKRINITA